MQHLNKIAAFIFFLCATSLAHPVSYKGSIGIMTWNQPFLSDHWLTYSFSAKIAGALRGMRMRMPMGDFVVLFPQVDVLLKRWNNPHSQANIYIYGGFGGACYNNKKGYAGQIGAEIDAESRSWFFMAKWETMPSNIEATFHHAELRFGLAPYEAEFDELASWFMVHLQYHPTLRPTYAITPIYRMFYKNVLWEAGVSLQGDFMLNLMFHF